MVKENVSELIITESVNLYKSLFGPKNINTCVRFVVDKYIQPQDFSKLALEFGITKNDYIDFIVNKVKDKI